MQNTPVFSLAKRKLVLLSALLTLAGCSTPAYFGVPNQRFDSPTVSGETWKGSAGIAYETPTFVVTVKDIEATPPSSSGSEITKDPTGFETSTLDRVSLDLRIGLFKQFEISHMGDMFHVKYQFMGSPRLEAKANEWVGAITVDSFGSTRETEITSGSNVSKYELEASGVGGSVIVGYRDDKNVIYYLNLNYLDFDADTDITQNSTPFSYSDDGSQLGAILGIRYEQSPKGFYAALEWSYSKTKWADLKDKEWGTAGGVLGVSW
jgi:hypothetical protein